MLNMVKDKILFYCAMEIRQHRNGNIW